MNLGLLSIEMVQPAEALRYSTKALQQARLTGEALELGNIYKNMGLAYHLQEEFSQAENYIRQAEAVFRRFFNLPGVVGTLENLGRIYFEQRRWSEAIACQESALEAWRTLGHKPNEIQVLLYLAECELAGGNQLQAKLWLTEAEYQLSQHPQAGRYYQFPDQLAWLHRGLADLIINQTAVK
jgi:tetratricopeptide (TPR) repeat protein